MTLNESEWASEGVDIYIYYIYGNLSASVCYPSQWNNALSLCLPETKKRHDLILDSKRSWLRAGLGNAHAPVFRAQIVAHDSAATVDGSTVNYTRLPQEPVGSDAVWCTLLSTASKLRWSRCGQVDHNQRLESTVTTSVSTWKDSRCCCLYWILGHVAPEYCYPLRSSSVI